MPTTVLGLTDIIWHHPANRGRRVRALAASVGWQVYKRAIRRPVNIRAFGDMRFRAYPDSTEPGRLLYFGGLPDYHEMWFMRRYLRPGDRVIDGGANAGLYTLLASKLVGPTGHVDAFEGAPATAERLRENVALNAIVQAQVHQVALAGEPGTVDFTVNRAKDSANRIRTDDDSNAMTVQVEAVVLDHAVSGRYAFGKLDVEGAEGAVLSGAHRMLSEHSPPVWQLELVDRFSRRFGWTRAEVVEFLRSCGYMLADYDADTNNLAVGREPGSGRPDVLAVAVDSLDEVLERITSSDQ